MAFPTGFRLLLVLGVAIPLIGCEPTSKPVDGGVESIALAGDDFDLELAMGPESRNRGLAGRTSLAPDEGMLFVFPDVGTRSFWMYGCLMDIDIAFVDPIGYVTAIHTMPAEPPRGNEEQESTYQRRLVRYTSGYPAQFAIEIAPGRFAELGISVGDRLSIPPKRLKTLSESAEAD